MHDAEAIVVGGGPAGSIFAGALASAGHRVLLLDKARFPRHKACSDYMSPAGAQILSDLGLLDEALLLGASRMPGMIVHAPNGDRFTAHYARAEPGRAALGLTRYHMDHLLLDHANAAGVDVREGAHVRSLLRSQGRVTGVVATIDGTREEIRAPLVIGADGRNSVVARELEASRPLRWPRKTGLSMHYRGVSGLDRFGEMHISDGIYAGLAILEDGVTNVTIVLPSRDVAARTGSMEDLIAASIQRLPGIACKLEGTERIEGIRGVGSMGCRSTPVAGDGYLLIGDAASFLDPFAGEGIHDAMRSGLLAAAVAHHALQARDLSGKALDPYRIARRRTFTAKHSVSWIVQAFINTPPLMNYVTPRLSGRDTLGLTISGVLGGFRPAQQALSPFFLARLLRP